MADVYQYRFRIRRRTAASWASLDEVLLDSEMGLESDTRKIKIGDGVTPWNSLSYFGGGGGATWRNGTGVPSNALGVDGDYYLNNANGDVYEKSAGVYAVVANIQGPTGPEGPPGTPGTPGPPGPPGPSSSAFFGSTFNGGGGDIAAGSQCSIPVPFGFDITKITLVADAVGSIVIDVWIDTYANFPPTVADSVCGSSKPTLASARKYQDTSLTGWTVAVASNSVITFNVDSCTGIKNATILIEGVRT